MPPDEQRPGPPREDYALWTYEKLRYGDTDRQGHVNNAVFATMLETGRVELLLDPAAPLNDPGCSFVIASLELSFKAEIRWPGRVEIGTRVAAIGRSSVTLDQVLYQDGILAATARTVIVQTDPAAGRSRPFSEASVRRLEALKVPATTK